MKTIYILTKSILVSNYTVRIEIFWVSTILVNGHECV